MRMLRWLVSVSILLVFAFPWEDGKGVSEVNGARGGGGCVWRPFWAWRMGSGWAGDGLGWRGDLIGWVGEQGKGREGIHGSVCIACHDIRRPRDLFFYIPISIPISISSSAGC